ncbi:MAG: hypothetical protein ACSLFF_10385 [Solirubrobacterales bacterium]
MADDIETPEGDSADVPGGSLADAIAAHLALKQEHGADPEEVVHELEDALSPPIREEAPAAAAEPAPEPEPEPEPAPEPAPAPAPAPEPEPEPAPAQEPITETAVASSVEEPKSGEITGTIEFEFGEEEAQAAEEPEAVDEDDLLEATPDFFEETPEHDKLWFDEAPPRKFDF